MIPALARICSYHWGKPRASGDDPMTGAADTGTPT